MTRKRVLQLLENRRANVDTEDDGSDSLFTSMSLIRFSLCCTWTIVSSWLGWFLRSPRSDTPGKTSSEAKQKWPVLAWAADCRAWTSAYDYYSANSPGNDEDIFEGIHLPR